MKTVITAATLAVAVVTPAHAEIIESSVGGFATRHSAVVTADRRAVWNALLQPENWWSHTWSNDSGNLRLEARAGGCFCETLPAADGWAAGSVEHMRVVFVQPGSTLRMSGSLGPLQSEGLAGTLTVTLEDEEAGTRITWEYVTGGETRFDLAQIAPVVDSVQGEFLADLVAEVGDAVDDPG
ncbi:SRPBCC domain-containing protein [Aurantiacibacter aquimixticola]|uniref:ATPase n=1 Tax=Aurantiacibacter aquimixticola TaxID=1958945 RepID=A0A419RT21_9SPHN|nr:SRPBCC domain-containing protein [Aurantiacibacter aquimixticola]RJY08919.1 ATPase [Aurantiacibacter aquimixticola]